MPLCVGEMRYVYVHQRIVRVCVINYKGCVNVEGEVKVVSVCVRV